MLLTKQQILERRLKTARVEIEPGLEVIVRALPLHIIERAQKTDSKAYSHDAFVFVNALVDEKGARIYTDEDVALVAETVDLGLMQLVVSKGYALARVDKATLEQIKNNWTSQAGEPQ